MASVSVPKPKVLVLLAAHDGAHWIRTQLESILRQTGVEPRVVVSDDVSTDDTREQVAYFARSGNVRLISPDLATGSSAQNFFSLIRSNPADGFNFVAFSDQDDLWHTDKLDRARRALSEHHAGGYSSAVTAVWPNSRARVLRQIAAPTAADFLFEGAGQGCTFVLSAEFYGRVRQFVTTHRELTRKLHYHDWCVYALARCWGVPWFFDPQPTMEYRQHGGNDTGARNSAAGIIKRLSLIRTGWYREQLLGIADLCIAAGPSSKLVPEWHALLSSAHGFKRQLRIARFCALYGRRRATDRIVLALAALSGSL